MPRATLWAPWYGPVLRCRRRVLRARLDWHPPGRLPVEMEKKKLPMRIVRDVAHVQRSKRRARWMALVGFLMLGSTFWVLVFENLWILAYALMLAGFVVFNRGMQEVGKWSRPVRNDQIIDQALAKVGDRHTMAHFVKAGGKTFEHLLIHPGGVVVFITREMMGKVSVKGGRWRKRGGGALRLFSMGGPQLGNPSYDTQKAVSSLEALLEANDLDVPVDGAIVFTDPRADIEAEAPDWPVVLPRELPLFVRDLPAEPELTATERARLSEVLLGGQQLESNAPVARRRRPVKRRAGPAAKRPAA